jgi:hypothetical protein
MDTTEQGYLCDAGRARAAWHARPRPQPAERRAWDKWLVGLVIAVASSVALGLMLMLNSTFGPYEATARMERVAAHLDRMGSIRPETARAIMRVISQPGYDCEQVACDATLKRRNLAVRFRLASLVTAKGSLSAAVPAKLQRETISSGKVE